MHRMLLPVDHVLIHREVLPKDRNIHCFCDLTEISITSHEIKWLCEAGDRRCTCCFVFFRNFQIRKFRCDQPLGGGSFFYFTDVGHTRLFQRFQKGRLLWCFFCQGFQLFQGKLTFFLPDTFSCFSAISSRMFFRSFFVCLLDISVQLSFGTFKKSDRLMFPFVSLPIGIADFSSAAIIFKSRYLI